MGKFVGKKIFGRLKIVDTSQLFFLILADATSVELDFCPFLGILTRSTGPLQKNFSPDLAAARMSEKNFFVAGGRKCDRRAKVYISAIVGHSA